MLAVGRHNTYSPSGRPSCGGCGRALRPSARRALGRRSIRSENRCGVGRISYWSHWRATGRRLDWCCACWVRSNGRPVTKHFALIGLKGIRIRDLRLMRPGRSDNFPIRFCRHHTYSRTEGRPVKVCAAWLCVRARSARWSCEAFVRGIGIVSGEYSEQ
jgi:hypothetical protein